MTQLLADDEVVANAIEYTAWFSDPIQVELCSCGVEGCAADGWVSLRRSGRRLLLTPVFDLPSDLRDYAPPHSFARRGLPLLEAGTATTFARTVGLELGEVPVLRARDVARMLQWMAPARMLGWDSESPTVRRADVLASTSGDLDEVLDQLDARLAEASASTAELVLREPTADVEPIGLFLDLPGHPEWSVLARSQDRIDLFADGLLASLEPA